MVHQVSILLLLANVASTWLLVGLIWFVTVSHYPLFALVGLGAFTRYHAAHSRRTTLLVALPMLIEAFSSAVLALWPPLPELRLVCVLGLALVVVIWFSTAALQMPRHRVLALGYDAACHQSLVRTNWIRTLAWTGRGLLVLLLVHHCFDDARSNQPIQKARAGRQVAAAAPERPESP